MNSIPFYRDFGVAGELTQRPRGEPAPARRGLLRRIVDAIERSRQRATADRRQCQCSHCQSPLRGCADVHGRKPRLPVRC